jgi:hypothetical protein
MFEALMPALFVPEEQWGPRSWAINHPLTIAAQIHHGLIEAEYGYWGFSPANVPGRLHLRGRRDRDGPDGYKSNKHPRRPRFGDCSREPQPDPSPSVHERRGDPACRVLALRWAPDA